jgi:hypothetical protein
LYRGAPANRSNVLDVQAGAAAASRALPGLSAEADAAGARRMRAPRPTVAHRSVRIAGMQGFEVTGLLLLRCVECQPLLTPVKRRTQPPSGPDEDRPGDSCERTGSAESADGFSASQEEASATHEDVRRLPDGRGGST